MLKAVITGVAGQDGSYLAELLLERGYTVYGVRRRLTVEPGHQNLRGVLEHDRFHLVYGDIGDPTFVSRLLHDVRPHEYYNLAALSHVGQSFHEPVITFEIDATAVVMQLEAIRTFSPSTRFYQASTSELFGKTPCAAPGHDESARMHPRSPYAVAKLAAYWATIHAREAWGLHASNGILFNHSSPRRGLDFATRKITRGVAAVKLGLQSSLRMGDLSSSRDEGLSAEYMEAAWRMVQQDAPDDYVIGTGRSATIEQMFRHVCERAGLAFEDVYELDERFLRPSEVPFLQAHPKKAEEVLGWRAEHHWEGVLDVMFEHDLRELTQQMR